MSTQDMDDRPLRYEDIEISVQDSFLFYEPASHADRAEPFNVLPYNVEDEGPYDPEESLSGADAFSVQVESSDYGEVSSFEVNPEENIYSCLHPITETGYTITGYGTSSQPWYTGINVEDFIPESSTSLSGTQRASLSDDELPEVLPAMLAGDRYAAEYLGKYITEMS